MSKQQEKQLEQEGVQLVVKGTDDFVSQMERATKAVDNLYESIERLRELNPTLDLTRVISSAIERAMR